MKLSAHALLALTVSSGFFAVIAYMLTHGIPDVGSAKDVLLMMIGTLTGNFTSVMAFYFGSSKGDVDKSETVAKALDKATPDVRTPPSL